MLHFIRFPKRICHTDRSYLTQWFFKDTLIITDVDINDEADLEKLIAQHACKNVLVDLSHNAMPDNEIPEYLKQYPRLTTMYHNWYTPSSSNVMYFSVWAWMFSNRSNQFFHPVVFDASGAKTQPMMCLNRNLHPHRVMFRQFCDPAAHKIVWSYGSQLLPGENTDDPDGMSRIDIGVGPRAYSQCAVNIVTETVLDRQSLSEKSFKPFVARQIPVLVAAPGANQFLKDLGLDMYEDIVPWHTWDNEVDEQRRLQMIADFVCNWVTHGSPLGDYQKSVARVESNKQYIHSDSFRQMVLRHMPNTDPFTL